MPQAAKLPGTSGFFKNKTDFLEKVQPQAAKLPRTSGFLKQVGFLRKTKLPRPSGSVARKLTTTAAKGAKRLLGGLGGVVFQEAGGCGGAQPPRLLPPDFEPNFD